MAEFVPPDEMAEIIKEQLAGECIGCQDNVVWEGTPEDIDMYNPDDFKKYMRLVGEVHINGGISEVEEYIKQLGNAYGAPITLTTDARQVAKDWLEKKFEEHSCSHHDHTSPKEMEIDQTPMVVVDENNNFRFYCVKGKVDLIIGSLSQHENVHGWRGLTYEEFEELNKGI